MRGRLLPSLGSLAFLLIAPGTVGGVIPWWISGWRMQPPLFGWPRMRAIGVMLIAAGFATLLDSFARFALVGRGTPAPVLPTDRLVVSGLYRHVRNPMYLAVVSAIVDQGLLLGDMRVLIYGALVGAAFHAFVTLHEEPTLRRKYGASYEAYCRAVLRWRPRVRAWRE